MDQVLHVVSDCTGVYIHDILIYSPNLAAHVIHLERVLQTLHEARLMANRKKSHLGR